MNMDMQANSTCFLSEIYDVTLLVTPCIQNTNFVTDAQNVHFKLWHDTEHILTFTTEQDQIFIEHYIAWKLVVKERYRRLERRNKAFAGPWDLRFSWQWFWRMLHWNMMPCGLVEVCWCFEGMFCLHRLRGRKVSWGWKKSYCCMEKGAWGMVLSERVGVRRKWKTLRPFVCFPASIQCFSLLGFVFCLEDEGNMFFRNAAELLPDYVVPHLQYSSKPIAIWNSLIILMCRTHRYICARSMYCIWRERFVIFFAHVESIWELQDQYWCNRTKIFVSRKTPPTASTGRKLMNVMNKIAASKYFQQVS